MKRVIQIIVISFIFIVIIDLLTGFLLNNYKRAIQWENRVHIWESDTILGWVNKSDTSVVIETPEYYSYITIDSDGFRYNPYNCTNDSAIIFFGDSYVQGLEVSDSFTFTAILQKYMDYRIINAGVRGYGTDQEYIYMQKLFENRCNIKTAVLMFYINDFYDILTDNRDSPSYDKPVFHCLDGYLQRLNFPVHGNKENLPSPDIYTGSTNESSLANILYKSNIITLIARYCECSQFGNLMYRAGIFKKPQYMSRDWEIMNDTILNSSIKILDCLFDSISNLCTQNSIELKVLIIPYMMQYDSKMQMDLNKLERYYGFSPDYNNAIDTLIGMLNKKGIENYCPIDVLAREHKKERIVYRYDEHFNKNGHEVISRIITQMLFYEQP